MFFTETQRNSLEPAQEGRVFIRLRPAAAGLRRDRPAYELLLATGGRVLNPMGNSQGRDNVKKRRARRKKTERLALAKRKQKAAK